MTIALLFLPRDLIYKCCDDSLVSQGRDDGTVSFAWHTQLVSTTILKSNQLASSLLCLFYIDSHLTMTTVAMSPNVNEDGVFSWENYRAERRKSDKEERARRKSSSKTESSKKKESSSSKKSKETKKRSSSNKEKKSKTKTLDASFNLLEDESGRTEATVPMTESESTLSSLQESSAECHDAAVAVEDLPQEEEEEEEGRPDNVLDHVVLAAADLDSAMEEFEAKTGVTPVKAGHINGLGITKARVAFEGGSSFLEIIAPDLERPGPIGDLLRESFNGDELDTGALVPFHWAIRLSSAETLASEAPTMGYTPDILAMKGPSSKDGTSKQWETLYLYGHELGGLCPFFVNWDTYDHPCETLPIVGSLIHVNIRAPKDDKVHTLLEHTGSMGFTVEQGEEEGKENCFFEVKFDSPEGEISFTADKMRGFEMPGYEEAAAAAAAAGENGSMTPAQDQAANSVEDETAAAAADDDAGENGSMTDAQAQAANSVEVETVDEEEED
jgi:hypothetical protein